MNEGAISSVKDDDSEITYASTVGQAARLGYFNQLVSLIENKHPVDACDNRGWRPTHEAAAGNHVECLKFLLEHEDTALDWQAHNMQTALYIAVLNKSAECVSLLLEAGANPNIADAMQDTPLLIAARTEQIDIVRLLLSSSADINQQDFNGCTALHFSVDVSAPDIVSELLDHNARIDLSEEADITPVFTAAQRGHTECLQLLLDALQNAGQMQLVNKCADDNASPLFLAAQEGNVNCVRQLLTFGADANIPTEDPIALPLHAALQFNHVDCIDLLLPVTDHSKLSCCSASPFYFSMMHHDVVATKLLVQAGIDVNAAFEAADDDEYQPKVLRYFNSKVRFGRRFSPLVVLALYEYSLGHAEILLAAGASPNVYQPCRVPPLLPALDMFNLQLVTCLIASGANVNVYHRWVIGNMAVIVCLHFWRGLQLMLRCGAEVESLFALDKRCVRELRGDKPSFESDDEETINDDYEFEFGALNTPIPLWRIIAEARYVMTRRGVTVVQVLNELLFFTTNVRLDSRLFGYMDSAEDWRKLKAITESPRRLAHLCRIRIRRCFNTKQLLKDDELMQLLPLPKQIIDYLLYSDLN